jgi:OmpR family two-component system sensor histidine kinase YxdK
MSLLKAFLKDQRLDFAGYACITILILFFYYLKFGSGIEIIYPILMALFVVFVITMRKGFHYFRFHKALKTDDYKDFMINGSTNQENEVIKRINDLQQHFYQEISQLVYKRDKSNAFLAQMVHDLKIPISLIRLVLDEMEAIEEESVKMKENLSKIKIGSDQVLEKLSQMLCYLRLGQFEKDFVIERVNLIEEIRNAINEKKDYFILHKIYPRFNSQQPAIYVLTDRKWNGMLLDQIISNAIKYSAVKKSEGYVHFDVNQTNNSVELSITDFGIGIPAYDMERIYEPFFTGENGRQVGNSSGIGLYICRNICENMGHHLSVDSVRGEKTKVKINYLSKL